MDNLILCKNIQLNNNLIDMFDEILAVESKLNIWKNIRSHGTGQN